MSDHVPLVLRKENKAMRMLSQLSSERDYTTFYNTFKRQPLGHLCPINQTRLAGACHLFNVHCFASLSYFQPYTIQVEHQLCTLAIMHFYKWHLEERETLTRDILGLLPVQ